MPQITLTRPVDTPLPSVLVDELETTGAELPCWSFEPEVFFAETQADVEFAKSICSQCPARVSCLAGALERGEPWGIWGGELFDGGVVIARKRPRGRPRKSEVAA